MKTYVPKENELVKKWYLVDAKGKTLGHLATKIADVLRGKNKPTFTPHLDTGDFIIVINSKEVKLTANKLDKKTYYTHSGYQGSLKEKSARKLLETTPEKVLELAVKGMLPKNRLRQHILKKLKIYPGETHPHEAQTPEVLSI